MLGARKGISTADAELPGAIQIELALMLRQALIGLSEDRNKCFDCFDSRTTIPLAEALGLPRNISRPLQAYYALHRRRFVINQQAGPLVDTFSLVQGDAWSTRLVNAAFSVLARS